jgi:organic radical activating enzyme
MSSYCPLPFYHTTISTQGYYNVCCANTTPKKNQFHLTDGDFHNWQQNEYCVEVKDYFKKGKQHPGCSACWAREQQGTISYRQQVLKEYKILQSTNKSSEEKLLNIEVNVGNLCNLSCLMCSELLSSSILAENKKLKINQYIQKDFKWDADNFVALAKNLALKPKVINIIGGEPFYNKKIFELLDSLDSNDVKNTVLHITTNATMWNNKWASTLSKFKLVRIMFSIDAVGQLYNYIRYPGNFLQVEDNIKSIIVYKNFKPLIHATVQNLNILYLGELIEWSNRLGVYLDLFAVSQPDYLHFSNLPPALKLKAIDHLTSLISLLPESHITKELNSYKTVLENSSHSEQLWESFISNISLRDNLRGNSFKDFLY